MLDLDITLFVILILVWGLMIALNKLFFKPIGDVIEKREKKLFETGELMNKMNSEIEEKTIKIEEELNKAGREIILLREEIIKQGEETKDRAIEKARQEAKLLMEKEMKKLDKEVKVTEEKLEKHIPEYVNLIKKKFFEE